MNNAIKNLTHKQALKRITELEEELKQVKDENEQLQSLYKISKAVSSSLNIKQVFATILTQINKIVAFDSATLMLVEDNNLRAVAADGFSNNHIALNLYPRSSQNSAWRVVQSKSPLIISNVQNTIEWENRPGLNHIKAWLGLPLIVKDHVIGVLTLDSRQANIYNTKDAQHIFHLVYHIAVAVENAFLFERLKNQQKQNVKLQTLNHAIASVLNLDTLLTVILQQIAQILESKQAALWLFNQTPQTTTIKTWYATQLLPKDKLNFNFNIAQHPATQHLVDKQEPMLIDEISFPFQQTHTNHAKLYSSLLSLPLQHNNKTIGLIIAQNTEKRESFLNQQLTLAANAANQAALSIRIAQLFATLQKQANRLQLLNEVLQQISTILNSDDLFRILTQVIYEQLNYFVVAIFETNFKKQIITLKAVAGDSPNWLLADQYQQKLNQGAFAYVIESGQSLLINNIAETPYHTLIPKIKYSSALIVPTYINNKIEALLTIFSPQSYAFDKNDVWTLEALGKQMAIAIENARLFEQIQQHSSQLEQAVKARTVHLTTINEISRAISSIVTTNQLFATVTQLISQLFNQARVSIALRTGNYLNIQHVYDGSFEADCIPFKHRLKINTSHLLGQTILSGQANWLDDINTQDLYLLEQNLDPPSVAMAAPLTIANKSTGLIIVQNKNCLDSYQQDLDTLQVLASQVAVAMENSRLLQKSHEMAIVQERTRLAHDIHDGIAQSLAYLLLQVDRCLIMAETNNAKLEDELENMSQVISKNIEELRRNIFDLRPIGLENRSIATVFKQLSREFGNLLNIKTNCQIIGAKFNLPEEIETNLYRVFQEALSNIRRHARCKQVWIKLKNHKQQAIELNITDDGIGFDPKQLNPNVFQQHGLGLISMQERIRTLGGTLEIDSTPGQGTSINIYIPI